MYMSFSVLYAGTGTSEMSFVHLQEPKLCIIEGLLEWKESKDDTLYEAREVPNGVPIFSRIPIEDLRHFGRYFCTQ